MNQNFNNIQNWFSWNETKKQVAQKPQNVYSNGIIRNAYDTYLSVIFNKKFILNSRSKSKIDRQAIIQSLENIGLTSELCKEILFDFWFGGGAGITVFDETNQIRYLSMYEPYNCGIITDSFDYKKSKIIKYKDNQLYYHNNPIQGSYFVVKKNFDNFGNCYSVVDLCITALHTYAKLEAYNYSQASNGFQRNTFYKLDNEMLSKITENDDEVLVATKKKHNIGVFETMRAKVMEMFAIKDNRAKIINSSLEPVFVDTEIDLEKMTKYKDGLIKTIALCCNVPASTLGISNSANKSQSESDKDMLTNQAGIITNIFCDIANYWLSQFYPSLANDLFFSWEENETDESLQIREQNQKVLEFYTQNSGQFSALGITVDRAKLIELANDVSIPDLFVIQEAPSTLRFIDEELLDDVFTAYHETVNLSYSELLNWSQRDISKEASLNRDPINRNLALLEKNKEDWTNQDITNANKSIAFISRMKNGEQGQTIKIDGKDTGWSKRDISLMNWAYNPKKTTRAVKTDGLKTVDIEEWENQKDVQDTQIEILTKFGKYTKSQLKTRSEADLEAVYPKSNFISDLQKLSQSAINLYNQNNATNYNNLTTVDEYIQEVAKITYTGQNDYKGIWNTIDKAVVSNTSFEQIAKTSLMNIQGNLFVPLFNNTIEKVAVEDGANYIGTVAKNDTLVRKLHLDSQNKIWRIGDISSYWLEPRCRCNRFYGTAQELLDAGFSNPNNYEL